MKTFLSVTAVARFAHAISVAIVLGTFAQINAARAANIVWVSHNGPLGFSGPVGGFWDDTFITNLLQTAGHNVIRFAPANNQNTALTPEEIQALNTNDLIIFSRSINSPAFQTPGAQTPQWNTEITVPLIITSPYLVRPDGGRFGWFTGGTLPDTTPPTLLEAPDLGDPNTAYLFQDVSMNGNFTTDSYDVAIDRNTSTIVQGPVAGGKTLARATFVPLAGGAEVTAQIIAEFPPGTAVRGGADILAGYRMFFAAGSREADGGGVPTAGKENLTTDTGELIFLRAVELAANGGVPPNIMQEPIIIATHPQSQTVDEGRDASLSVTLSQGSLPRYQWYLNDTPVVGPGATAPTLVISGAGPDDAGDYYVVITNSLSVVTSEVATVTVTPDTTPPQIYFAYATAPDTAVVLFSEPVEEFSAENLQGYFFESTDGSGDLVFAGLIVLTNGTNATITITPPLTVGRNYKVVVSDIQDLSAAANVIDPNPSEALLHQLLPNPVVDTDTTTPWRYMEATAPAGWEQPGFDDSSWTEGFNGFATPTGDTMADPTYTINTTTISAPSATHVADYFRTHFNWPYSSTTALVEFSGAFDDGGAVYLNGEELFRVRMPGGDLTDSTLATGGGAGEPAHEVERFTTIVDNLQSGDNVLAVRVHQNATGSSDVLLAARLRLTVADLPAGPPTITMPPVGATIMEGASHVFNAQASGQLPLSYQWLVDGADILEATNSSYAINNALPSQSGSYQVRVSNDVNPAGILSDPAVLTVTPDTTAPTIVSAVGETNLVTFRIAFSEPVAQAGAETPGNYVIELAGGGGALGVISATLTNGNEVILLTGTARTPGQNYTITVNNVTDTAETGNPVSPNTRAIAVELILLAPNDPTVWRYDQSSNDLAAAGWQLAAYDDSSWETGLAGFSTPTAEIVPAGFELRTTNLVAVGSGGPETTYYRVNFDFPGDPAGATLVAQGVIDDGAVFYINGQEAGRIRIIAPGPVSFTNDATVAPETSNTHDAETVALDASALVTGNNLLAVELHQGGTASSDAILSIALIAQVGGAGPPVDEPALTIGHSGDQIVISWDAPGFCLEETTELQDGSTVWVASSVQSGVPFAPAGGQKFYRLTDDCP